MITACSGAIAGVTGDVALQLQGGVEHLRNAEVDELGDHQAVEMVVRGTEISFYVSEDDKPADLDGGTFRLFVQNGSDVMSSGLTIKGNRLIAKLAKPVASGAKVVLTGKDGHGHVLQARFVRK